VEFRIGNFITFVFFLFWRLVGMAMSRPGGSVATITRWWRSSFLVTAQPLLVF
jgi:hypothetical protein